MSKSKKMTPEGERPTLIEYLEDRCTLDQARTLEDEVLRDAIVRGMPEIGIPLPDAVQTLRQFLSRYPADTRQERHEKRLMQGLLKAFEALLARWAAEQTGEDA